MTIFCQHCGSAVAFNHRTLTQRQARLLDYLRTHIVANGYAPSLQEIADEFGYRSLATVHEHLTSLERKGAIQRVYGESRAIHVVEAA